jgi:hypothetical protein
VAARFLPGRLCHVVVIETRRQGQQFALPVMIARCHCSSARGLAGSMVPSSAGCKVDLIIMVPQFRPAQRRKLICYGRMPPMGPLAPQPARLSGTGNGFETVRAITVSRSREWCQ